MQPLLFAIAGTLLFLIGVCAVLLVIDDRNHSSPLKDNERSPNPTFHEINDRHDDPRLTEYLQT